MKILDHWSYGSWILWIRNLMDHGSYGSWILWIMDLMDHRFYGTCNLWIKDLMDLMDHGYHGSWISWITDPRSWNWRIKSIFHQIDYLLGLLLEWSLLFTASGTLSGGGGNDKSFSLVDSYLSASQNACCLLVLWAALNPCQERDLANPPVVPESPLGGGWEGGGLDNLSFTALIEKDFQN